MGVNHTSGVDRDSGSAWAFNLNTPQAMKPFKSKKNYEAANDPATTPACAPRTSKISKQTTEPFIETYNPRTGEYEQDEWPETDEELVQKDIETVQEWERRITLHNCKPLLPHQGYRQSAAYCQEDLQGRLWLVDTSGRSMTQAGFCPFCGFQALDSTAPDKPMQIVPQDIALTPGDRPQRVWVQNAARVMMRHFQFVSVRVLASDGCHAKVVTEDRVQVTVCVENLEEIRGERCLPKMGEKKETKPKKDRNAVDPELMNKYMNMGG